MSEMASTRLAWFESCLFFFFGVKQGERHQRGSHYAANRVNSGLLSLHSYIISFLFFLIKKNGLQPGHFFFIWKSVMQNCNKVSSVVSLFYIEIMNAEISFHITTSPSRATPLVIKRFASINPSSKTQTYWMPGTQSQSVFGSHW